MSHQRFDEDDSIPYYFNKTTLNTNYQRIKICTRRSVKVLPKLSMFQGPEVESSNEQMETKGF